VRKESGARGPQPGGGRFAGSSSGAQGRGLRSPSPQPRYTGDVNEYRSPMQDSRAPSLSYGGQRGGGRSPGNSAPRHLNAQGNGRWSRGPRSEARGLQERGRGVAPQGAPGEGQERSFEGNRSQGDQSGAAPQGRGGPPASGAQRRPQAPMFSINCNACGKSAEVPFQPAEGRDVFCQECYRARKPLSQQG
jgi:CxxC-x17-CxxC domain-containing protein